MLIPVILQSLLSDWRTYSQPARRTIKFRKTWVHFSDCKIGAGVEWFKRTCVTCSLPPSASQSTRFDQQKWPEKDWNVPKYPRARSRQRARSELFKGWSRLADSSMRRHQKCLHRTYIQAFLSPGFWHDERWPSTRATQKCSQAKKCPQQERSHWWRSSIVQARSTRPRWVYRYFLLLNLVSKSMSATSVVRRT